MIAIHTKYIGPTHVKGAKIKAAARGPGDKLYSETISYPYGLTGANAHLEAVKELASKYGLDWDLSNMRFGDSADGKGYVFCFDKSTVSA